MGPGREGVAPGVTQAVNPLIVTQSSLAMAPCPMRLRFFALLWCLTATCWPTVHATTVKPPQFAAMASGSDYVVRARVKSLSAHQEQRGTRTVVVTQMELEVVETIAGTPPQPLVLRMLGGTAGGLTMRVTGTPRFSVGDEDILFVSGNGRNFSPLYAVMHGRYPIRKDAAGREYVSRSNLVPLSDVAEVATPMAEGPVATLQARAKGTAQALTPAQFAAQIRTQREKGGINALR